MAQMFKDTDGSIKEVVESRIVTREWIAGEISEVQTRLDSLNEMLNDFNTLTGETPAQPAADPAPVQAPVTEAAPAVDAAAAAPTTEQFNVTVTELPDQPTADVQPQVVAAAAVVPAVGQSADQPAPVAAPQIIPVQG